MWWETHYGILNELTREDLKKLDDPDLDGMDRLRVFGQYVAPASLMESGVDKARYGLLSMLPEIRDVMAREWENQKRTVEAMRRIAALEELDSTISDPMPVVSFKPKLIIIPEQANDEMMLDISIWDRDNPFDSIAAGASIARKLRQEEIRVRYLILLHSVTDSLHSTEEVGQFGETHFAFTTLDEEAYNREIAEGSNTYVHITAIAPDMRVQHAGFKVNVNAARELSVEEGERVEVDFGYGLGPVMDAVGAADPHDPPHEDKVDPFALLMLSQLFSSYLTGSL